MHGNGICNLLVSEHDKNIVQQAYFKWRCDLEGTADKNVLARIVTALPESAGGLRADGTVSGVTLSQAPEAFLDKLNEIGIQYKRI